MKCLKKHKKWGILRKFLRKFIELKINYNNTLIPFSFIFYLLKSIFLFTFILQSFLLYILFAFNFYFLMLCFISVLFILDLFLLLPTAFFCLILSLFYCFYYFKLTYSYVFRQSINHCL